MFTKESFFKQTNVSRETMEKIEIYADLLQRWQKSINLIGPNTATEAWQRHFFDSAQLFTLIQKNTQHDWGETKELKWLDFGSGAGFPGLVLAIMGAGEFHMVESNGKKCTFMRQVVRETGASAIIHQERIEDLPPFPANYIVSRALASVDKLIEFSGPFVTEKTELWFLKGQDVEEELTKPSISRIISLDRYPSLTNEKAEILKIKLK